MSTDAPAPAEPSTFRKALRQKRFSVGLAITLLLVAFVITLFLADAGSRVAHELIGMRTL